MKNQPVKITLHLENVREMLLKRGRISRYRKRTIEKDVEQFLIEEATNLPKKGIINLVVVLPPGSAGNEMDIATALQKHFFFRKDKAKKQLKQVLRSGFRNLLIAFIFLGIIIFLNHVGSRVLPQSGLMATIRESLFILGWVAFWRPAELLLFEWYPILGDAKLFERLEHSHVSVVISDIQ